MADNKFISVLKAAGRVAAIIAADVPVVGTALKSIAALTPTDKDDKLIASVQSQVQDGLVVFQDIIVEAEQFGRAWGIAGPDKAKGAAEPVNALMMRVLPLLKGKKPVDEAITVADAAALGGALAKYLNGFEK